MRHVRTTLAGLAGALVLSAAPPAAAQPTTVDDQGLDRALKEVVRSGAVGVTARVDAGGESWTGAAGRARLRPSRPASEHARFRAASVNKQLTSVLALQLVERGTWSLGTTIGDVLPGLWPGRDDVTLRQLLSHTSGMPDYLAVLLRDAETPRQFVEAVSRRRTDRELVRAARTRDWLFEPGTDMTYSNSNFVVVGMMLKRQTGQRVPDLVERRILRRVGMTDSHVATGRRLPAPALHEYAVLEQKRRDLGRFHPTMFSSAGALVSTARDLNRFQRALSGGRLIGPGLLEEMRSVIGVDPELGVEYGLGSFRLPDPCVEGGFVHGHDGASWGTETLTFTSPDGRRRVTMSMTGRDLDGGTASSDALGRFFVEALAATCDGSAADTAPPRLIVSDPRPAGRFGR